MIAPPKAHEQERRHDDCMYVKRKDLDNRFLKIYFALFTTNLFKARSTIITKRFVRTFKVLEEIVEGA